MVSEQTISNAMRGVAFLLLYSLIASIIPIAYSPYLRGGLALLVAVGIFFAVDLVRVFLREESFSITEEWTLYSVRGLVLLILFVFVTAVAVDGFRSTTVVPEVALVPLAVAVGAVVVFGPVVGYYWRRSLTAVRD
ncbi:MAG: hypothetical protein U5K28_11025 [Halobacteriales archaeon]|nr:hypothetical protein [Halobacteriales archaeon]